MNEYLRERGKVSVHTSSKALRYLKSFFNWAITEQYLLENPCRNIKPIKVPQKQPLYLTESELEELLEVMDNKDLRDVVIFGCHTGLRKGEILSLQWTQINIQDRYVILDNNNGFTTKSKRVRTVPLNKRAFEVITERQKLNHNLVFSWNGNAFNPYYVCKQFKKCVIKAGLNPNLKFHSCRATFASWLIQRGVSIYEVSKLLGHNDLKTTEVYAFLSSENLRSAVDILN
jgi:site-specific recombinase XerD